MASIFLIETGLASEASCPACWPRLGTASRRAAAGRPRSPPDHRVEPRGEAGAALAMPEGYPGGTPARWRPITSPYGRTAPTWDTI